MYAFRVAERNLSVSVRDGRNVQGRLLSYYACPVCKFPMRFMAVFAGHDEALRAEKNFEASYWLKLQVSGSFLAGSTGGDTHARGTSVCSRVLFVGTDRELALRVLKALHADASDMALLKGRVDMTVLDGVDRVADQVASGNPPVLVVDRGYLWDPESALGGSIGLQEGYESWRERRRRLSSRLIGMVCNKS